MSKSYLSYRDLVLPDFLLRTHSEEDSVAQRTMGNKSLAPGRPSFLFYGYL